MVAAAFYSYLLLLAAGLSSGSSSVLGDSPGEHLDSPEEYLAHVFAILNAGTVGYDPEVEAFKSDLFRAKDAITSTHKKTGSVADVIAFDTLTLHTAEEGSGNLFGDSAGRRRSLRAPIGATRELAKSGKPAKAIKRKTKTQKMKSETETTATENTRAGENTEELEKKIEDLYEQLEQCHLEREKADDTPDWLFVQMSSQCSFFQQDKSYYVKLFHVSQTTYEFTDRPNRLARHMSTWAFAETFDDLFAGSEGFPNGAITFYDSKGFQTPVIGVFAGAPLWSNDDDGNLELTYQLEQEGNQREIFDVADIGSERYESCSFFIDGTEAQPYSILSKQALQTKVSELHSDLKVGFDQKGLLSKGYGLLDNYATSDQKQVNDLAVQTVNTALKSINDVVTLIKKGGSMTGAQIGEASGEIISSIGAVIAPFTGPVGPIVMVLGSLVSAISSFFSSSSTTSGGSYGLNLDTLKSVVDGLIVKEKMKTSMGEVHTKLSAAIGVTTTQITKVIQVKGYKNFDTDSALQLAHVFNLKWDKYESLISKLDDAYRLVYFDPTNKESAKDRITDYLNVKCGGVPDSGEGGYETLCNWEPWGTDPSHTVAKNFLYQGRENFAGCRAKLADLDGDLKALTTLAMLYQHVNYILSQLFHLQAIVCNHALPSGCSCPDIKTYADNNKFIEPQLELGSSCHPGNTITDFFTNLDSFKISQQRAFDLNQEFVPKGAIPSRPSFEKQCDMKAEYPTYWPSKQHCDRNSCNNAYLVVMTSSTYWNRWALKDMSGRSKYNGADNMATDGGQMQMSNWLHADHCENYCFNAIDQHPDAFKRGMFVYAADDDAQQTNPLDAGNNYLENVEGLKVTSNDYSLCYKMCGVEELSSVYKSIVALPTFCPANNHCGNFVKGISHS